jgi:hypothetical protein
MFSNFSTLSLLAARRACTRTVVYELDLMHPGSL